ncbi:MAG: hypothetical protein ABEJ56_01475 [Candidatus Nanohaloarchaea archaeon]
MGKSQYKNREELDERLREGIRVHEILHDESPPTNPNEAKSRDPGTSTEHPHDSIMEEKSDMETASEFMFEEEGYEARTDGGVITQTQSGTDNRGAETVEFRQDPRDQRWWDPGEGDFIYKDEMPDSLIYGDRVPEEEEYLGVDDLEMIRVLAQETDIDDENFLEEVTGSNINPVHEWQITQLLEGDTRYAVTANRYDGAPEARRDVEIPDEVIVEAREEYIKSRGYMPGTSIDSYVRDRTPETDEVDSQGTMGM